MLIASFQGEIRGLKSNLVDDASKIGGYYKEETMEQTEVIGDQTEVMRDETELVDDVGSKKGGETAQIGETSVVREKGKKKVIETEVEMDIEMKNINSDEGKINSEEKNLSSEEQVNVNLDKLVKDVVDDVTYDRFMGLEGNYISQPRKGVPYGETGVWNEDFGGE